MKTTTEALGGFVEPASLAVRSDTMADGALLSIAISLKRIADQLSGEAKGVTLHDYISWIHGNLQQHG